MEKKKAVVTILGKGFITPFEKRAIYYYEDKLNKEFNLKKEKYTNMFPLILDNFEDYTIVPIFTDEARDTNKKVLEDENISFDNFNKKYFISKDMSYDNILKLINTALLDYDEVIFDVSHGFRHLPILATVSLIVQNIKNINKIKDIIFAKEIKQFKKYEIVSLFDYLDLANLSFLLTNFKDNYTTSTHIKIRNKEYQNLLKAMNQFSADLMGLSLENLFNKSSNLLIDEIKNLSQDKSRVLLNELNDVNKHIEDVFSKKSHRYETYYYLAKDLIYKGYFVHSLSLIFEGIGFYLKSTFSKYDKDINKYIKEYEVKISNKEPKDPKKPDTIADYYDIVNSCKSFIFFDKKENRNRFFNLEIRDILYKYINEFKDIDDIKKYYQDVGDLRNNLLHANSGKQVDNTRKDIIDIVEKYKKLIIDGDILNKKHIEKEIDIVIPKKYIPPKRVNIKLNGLKILKKGSSK
ncbi:MAG: TM1812 family CRISPR-associated protein [Campylobacterota bacterium]|nr:TM1812 family CRISPR-associated protein [Campylobacterota bacterium]